MKHKLCSLFVCFVLIISLTFQASAAQVTETGSCGESAAYTLYSDGKLVISGTGKIQDHVFRSRKDITSVEIPGTISEIGAYAFADCANMKTVTLSEGVDQLGEGAFSECSSLTEIAIPDSVRSISGGLLLGEATIGAFDKCTSLTELSIGAGLEFIPWGAFSECTSLRVLEIPDTVTALDAYAFCSCYELTYVDIPASVEFIGANAFVNAFSLTTVVFRGDAPVMESPFFCSSFNIAGFYPENNSTWADADNIMAVAQITCAVPYTLDGEGEVIPVVPSAEVLNQRLSWFQNQKYPAGTAYPNQYSYIMNGNFITTSGEEAFAFQLSDELYGYLPISEKDSVVFSRLNLGDILYFGSEVCAITELGADHVTVAGVDENGAVYYGKQLTRAQVEAASACRTRCGVAPYPGELDPALDFELPKQPVKMPTEEQVYEKILSLKDTYPEGMPYSSKNHFSSKTESPVWYEGEVPMVMSMYGHGCSAFGFMVSDLCFGTRTAYLIDESEMDYDTIKVGDNLIGYNHQVIVLEVYPDHLVVVEGNYDEIIHWGRILTREEVQGNYQIYTRYSDGLSNPKPTTTFDDVEPNAYYAEAVNWAVANEITTGTGNNTFSPDATCTRGQVVTFLWRAAGEPEPTSANNPFSDVKESDYFYKAVLWAVENGITSGTGNGKFSPNDACSRGQVVTFLYRAEGEPAVSGITNNFNDVGTGDFYYEAVLWAVENEITTGTGNSTFSPNATCIRGQIVTFLHRAYD